MKQNWRTAVVKNLKQNGWLEINGAIKPKNKLTEKENLQIYEVGYNGDIDPSWEYFFSPTDDLTILLLFYRTIVPHRLRSTSCS